MENPNLEYKDQEIPQQQSGDLKGVIKPKKQLDEITQQMVVLFTDFYNVYLDTKRLPPIKDIKAEIETIKSNEDYHPVAICLLLILFLVNNPNGDQMARILRGVYNTYIVNECEPYTAVSNIMQMYRLEFDENNNLQLATKEEDEVEIEIGSIPDGVEDAE